MLDRIDLGDVEHVRDDRIGRGSPALRGDVVLLAEADDVPVDEEELREPAAVDDVELVRELLRDVTVDARVLHLRALVAERVEEGERRLARGHREARQAVLADERGFSPRHVRVVEQIEDAGVGDRASVAKCFVEPREALPQERLALEPVLAVGLEAIPGFVERDPEVDAAEHVMQSPPLGTRVVDVVGDDAPQPRLARERRELVAERRIVGIEMVRELDEEPLAEDGSESREQVASAGEIAGPHSLWHSAVRAPGERVEAGGVLGEKAEGGLRLRLLAGELRRRDRASQAGPALPVACDEHEMSRVDELELGPEDRTNPPLLRRVGEAHRAIKAVCVGEGERVHALLDRRVDEVVHVRCTIKEAVVAVNV